MLWSQLIERYRDQDNYSLLSDVVDLLGSPLDQVTVGELFEKALEVEDEGVRQTLTDTVHQVTATVLERRCRGSGRCVGRQMVVWVGAVLVVTSEID